MLLTTAHRFIYGKRFILKMNRFNGFSFLFQNELNIMETVKTVGIHCIGLPRPRSWAEVKNKICIIKNIYALCFSPQF